MKVRKSLDNDYTVVVQDRDKDFKLFVNMYGIEL